jgi:hypothetical protein
MQIVTDIVSDKRKSLVPEQMGNILDPSGEKVIHADHGMSSPQQHITEMTPKKPGSACNKDAHTMMLSYASLIADAMKYTKVDANTGRGYGFMGGCP